MPDPLLAPLTPVCEVVQEKVVPATLLVRAIVLVLPEQRLCDAGVAVAEGIGLTTTVAVMADPVQPPTLGVMVYTAVPVVLPVAVSVWAMFVPVLLLAPLTPL